MKFEQQLAASYQAGFDNRLAQMAIKSAMAKEAGWLDRFITPIAAGSAKAAPGVVGGLTGFAARGVGSIPRGILGLARGGVNMGRAAIGGTVRGLATGLGGKGSWLARKGETFDRYARGTFRNPFKAPAPATPPTAANIISGATTPAGTPAAAAGAAPSATGAAPVAAGKPPGAASATGAAASGAAASPTVAPDPTGGIVQRMQGKLPQGVQDWMKANPNVLPASAGVLGGAGTYGALDQYGDYRRRKAIENLGFMDRLGLAFQLAASPRGFNQTIGL